MKKMFMSFVVVFGLITLLILAVTSWAVAATPDKPISWRCQAYLAGTNTYELVALRKFAERVKEKTQGKLDIKVFEAGTLGYSGFELQQVVADGLMEMAVTMVGVMASKQPAFGVSGLPFLFPEWRPEYDKIAPRLAVQEALPIFRKMAREMGLQFFPLDHVPDQLQATKRIATVEDFKGTKLRVWSPMIATFGKALGCTTVNVPYAELYTSFATKIVEANVGQSGPMIDFKFHEVAKYFCLWAVTTSQAAVIINQKAWEALDKKNQDIVSEGLADMSRGAYDYYWTGDWEKLKELKGYGVNVVEISPAEKAKIQKIIKKEIWDPWTKDAGEYGKQLLDIFMKY